MTTLREIAKKANVSVAAVSIVLHGGPRSEKRVSKKLAKKIQNIATRLNYRPSAMARSLVLKKTRMVGVLLRNASDRPFVNPANFELIIGIEEYLSRYDYLMVFLPLDTMKKDEYLSTRIFTEKVLDGIIVVDSHPNVLYKRVNKVFETTIFVETNYWDEKFCIRRDEEHAGSLAAQALVNACYKKFLYIGDYAHNRLSHFSARERLDGVLRILGKDNDNLHIKELNALSDLELFLEEDLEKIPGRGVICGHYVHAKLVHSYLAQKGLLCPRDYGLVCCDESYETSRTFSALSRISFDRYNLGQKAAEMILQRLGGDNEIPSCRFKGEWIEGKTISRQTAEI